MRGDSLMPVRHLHQPDVRPRAELREERRADAVLADPGDGGEYVYTLVVKRDFDDGSHGRDGLWIFRDAEAASARYRLLAEGDRLPGERVSVGAFRRRRRAAADRRQAP